MLPQRHLRARAWSGDISSSRAQSCMAVFGCRTAACTVQREDLGRMALATMACEIETWAAASLGAADGTWVVKVVRGYDGESAVTADGHKLQRSKRASLCHFTSTGRLLVFLTHTTTVMDPLQGRKFTMLSVKQQMASLRFGRGRADKSYFKQCSAPLKLNVDRPIADQFLEGVFLTHSRQLSTPVNTLLPDAPPMYKRIGLISENSFDVRFRLKIPVMIALHSRVIRPCYNEKRLCRSSLFMWINCFLLKRTVSPTL